MTKPSNRSVLCFGLRFERTQPRFVIAQGPGNEVKDSHSLVVAIFAKLALLSFKS